MSERQRPTGLPPGAGGIYTETLARLYTQQGFLSRALDIYHYLARTQPQNRQWRECIMALEKQQAATVGTEAPPFPAAGESRRPVRHAMERRLLVQLEQWLGLLRQRCKP